jgi:hypothetical protein
VNGRGAGRLKRSYDERLDLAANIALRRFEYVPSLKQTAAAFGVTVMDLRRLLKSIDAHAAARAQAQAQAEAQAQAQAEAAAWNAVQSEAETINEEADFVINTLMAVSPAGREAAFRTYGVGNVWNVISGIVT